MLAPEVSRLLGKKVGNFVISELLGQGGMGSVFVATHPVWAGEWRSIPQSSARHIARHDDTISAEARTAASLRHPNIVDIFDFGELNDRPYYVMELLEGDEIRPEP